MHELPVTQGILSVALEAAQNNGGGRITAIDLVIGEMASIVDDSVQFYFDILSKDTLAQGAELRFRREPGIATCLDCQHKSNVRPPILPVCPECGSGKMVVSGGREFYVESIEVDDDPENSSS